MTTSIAAIHVAKQQLGLDDDTYRAKLTRITGKPSVKDMTEAERQKVLTVFRNEGFSPAAAPRRPNGTPKLTGKYAKKLQALWIAGYNLGIVRDRDDAALVAFVKRQTGIDAVRFLRYPDDARKAIEAIKAILARDGGVVWSVNTHMSPVARSSSFKIAWAQWEKLNEPAGLFWSMVRDLGDVRPGDAPTDAQWVAIMNELGRRVRAMKGGA